jgi:DNA-binding CsgD family transcriptional regulator
LDGTDIDWMTGLVEKMDELFGARGLGAGGMFATGKIDDQGRTVLADVSLRHVADRNAGKAAGILAAMAAYPQTVPIDRQERTYFSSLTASTASTVTGLGTALADSSTWRHAGVGVLGAKDAVFLAGHDGPLGTVVLFDALRETMTLTPKELHVWQRIATHVGAAHRLRRNRDATPAGAEAVLSPTGQVQHLVPGAGREQIEEGFARRQHARRRDVSPEAALDVWKGLHDGRWSLVDHIDTDGKAFVLAVHNEPARDVVSTITDRQRGAVALAALGYSNKQIAYSLGLSAGAVAMLLTRAREATGARTRAELVSRFKRELAENK